MNKILGLGLILVLAVSAVAQDVDFLTIVDPEATTSASVDAAITKGKITGMLEGVYINLVNERELVSTNVATTYPDLDGVYFDIQTATYNSSNTYLSEDGTYTIRFESDAITNWALMTVASELSGPAWTNSSLIGTGWGVYGTAATGYLAIAATTTDVDIDIATVVDKGTGDARTLFSKDNVTSAGYFPVRVSMTGTGGTTTVWTNQPAKIPLCGDVISLSAYAATEENVKVTVYLFISK